VSAPFKNKDNTSQTVIKNSPEKPTKKAFLCTGKIYSFVTVKNNIHKIVIKRIRSV
jgi:hypothetical protein